MKNIFLFLAVAFICSGCKKEKKVARELEFDYLITSDVEWKFHFQGRAETYSEEIDSAYHVYAIARPNPPEFITDGHLNCEYIISREHFRNSDFLFLDTVRIVLREYLNEKMLFFVSSDGIIYNLPNMSFTTLNEWASYAGQNIDERFISRQAKEDGAVNIDGIETPKSTINLPGVGTVFFKARGIGGPYGPFGRRQVITEYKGIVVSMDFTYKGQTQHFYYGGY